MYYKKRQIWGFDSCDRPSNLKLDSNRQFFSPCNREIWWMTLKNNRALLLYYVKLCASFQIHWWIQTGVTAQKRLNSGQNWRYLIPLDLEIWRMTLKNNRAPLLCSFKLCASFHSHWWIQTEVYSPETPNLGQNRRFFLLCDLEIWRMTLKNNRAPLLYYIKLCASFQSHVWIQTGVTVRKRSIGVKIGNFLSRAASKFDEWPWKTIGQLSYAASSFVHHFIAIDEFKLELQSGNAQFGSKSIF